ncbi:hypothetical protein DZF91_27150 [Actinomadura logoneensis]|uniref:Uncharacterized protein n=1 Tax=Actinomadura logoneensis TaxID=2293572 RepID=A0A372JEZ3_9ACTN|nr:hypothetical protein [Actinomadura logoneensis]RFU38540.1 hypothetical protein DZF91_27150 [Actinomadura logoneensis]
MSLVLALLLFAAPAAGWWLLLSGLDPLGRLVVASGGAFAVLAGTAQVMLMADAWSPLGGVLAVGALSAVLAVLGRVRRPPREGGAASAPPPPPQIAATPPETGTATATRTDLPRRRRENDDEDWIYTD